MAKLQPTKWIWRDGEFIAWQDANVHVLSHSMQFGSSAFEGIRCYGTPRGPAIFRLEDHLQRLLNSCKIYRMDVPYTVDELVAAACELVERNGLDSCYVRPMVIHGYGAAGMVPFDSPVEIFLTGTASEGTPVRSVDNVKVGLGRAGEVMKMLQRTYLDVVQGKAEDTHQWLCHVRAERASVKLS